MSDQESTPPLRALPRRVQTVTVIIVLVSIVIGVLLFNRQGGNGFIDPGAPLPKVGEHISFGMYDKDNKAVLTDIQGQPFNINSLAGHPIWINAWASWCPPCKAEMPDLQILYTKERVEHPDLVLLLMNVGDDRISGVAPSRWTAKAYATRSSIVHLLSYASGDRYASAECRRCVL